MAGKKQTTSSSTPKISTPRGKKTVAEVQKDITARDQDYQKQHMEEVFKYVADTLHLVNLNKTQSRQYQSYDKDRLRTYLRNPKAYEDNIRSISQYLYRMCYSYRRIIWYNATMMDLNAVSVIPITDLTKTTNAKKTLKSYYATASKIQQMALDQCMLPMLITAWREDTAYGYIYDDGNTFFIHVLDGQYCRVSSNDGGVLRYAFDFSYFRSHEDDLEYWDSEFQKKYDKYDKGTADRWQELDYKREICLKVNIDDLTMSYPPFAPMFESIIDLVDLQSIQAVKDELSVYKLLVARLQPLSGTKDPDDFEIDIKTALKYYEKFVSGLPDCVSAAISPMPIESIEFNPTTTNDVDMISNSTKNLFATSGGSELLFNDNSGTTITMNQILMDTESALASLLPQVQAWCNSYLELTIGKDHCHVKYLKVSPYTRDTKKKELLTSAEYSVPTALAVGALDGFTPLEILSLGVLENNILDIKTSWRPLQSTHTQSGNATSTNTTGHGDDGAPTKDADDLSDDGAKTRENKK